MFEKFIAEKIKNLNDESGNKYANANTIEAMFEKLERNMQNVLAKVLTMKTMMVMTTMMAMMMIVVITMLKIVTTMAAQLL